jgi:hypothetical protein
LGALDLGVAEMLDMVDKRLGLWLKAMVIEVMTAWALPRGRIQVRDDINDNNRNEYGKLGAEMRCWSCTV